MDCRIIRDLMPLYIENLASEASNNLIQEHVKGCEECSQILNKLQADLTSGKKAEALNISESAPDELLKRIKKSILKKISVLAAIAFAIGEIIGMTTSKGFMFMAFYATYSILAFILAVLLSIAICRNKLPSRKKFYFIGNWTFLFSIILSFIGISLCRWVFNEFSQVAMFLILEIIYNIILSSTLRIYAWRKLPKNEEADVINVTDRNLYSILFATVIAVTIMITVPVTMLEKYRTVDNLAMLFVNDPDVLGKWIGVNFVPTSDEFDPEKHPWKGEVFVKEMVFLKDGKLAAAFGNGKIDTSRPWLDWTKGFIINKSGDHTASKYFIKEIKGSKYLFYEWKTSDSFYFHKPIPYYVLKKADQEGSAAANK
jgi:hypothetical protein